jgi:hypothetical protein
VQYAKGANIRALVCGYPSPSRQRELPLTLKGFIDDSGSEPSSPVFVLAGYVLPAKSWEHFSGEWEKTLHSGRPIEYLHMKETGKHCHGGQFAGWSVDEIDEKLLSLGEIIHAHQPILLAAHAKWSEFEKFKSRSARAQFVQNPYKALFHEIIRIMYGGGKQRNKPRSVDFVFDEQGDVGLEAQSWYLDIKAAFPPEARPFFGSLPEFKSDLKIVPLQAADMMAWFQRRNLCSPVTRHNMKKTEELITEFPFALSGLDADGFEKAAMDFEKVTKLRARGTGQK